MVTAVFSRRRKTIENALLALRPGDRAGIAAGLVASGIDARRRPETLEIAELARLSDVLTQLQA
jgi:16S rRNA A1518/A1519 N6-dimethyltransferase RsmA/KsgA/DIM1 with predicted DNA glycosylase/AP lyase activity